jgi:hypothetical protein
MPRRRKRREEDLIFTAIEALEDEIRCWRTVSDYRDQVRMVRYPPMSLEIGPAEITADSTSTIEHVDLPKKEVPFFLRYCGMQAAIKAMREAEA